tara:strand:- start:1754 stop:1870 length:117 start_codon:yes stop_codon:yes gene_type:complete
MLSQNPLGKFPDFGGFIPSIKLVISAILIIFFMFSSLF